VLAVPAASSPQEIYECHAVGARLIKVFPAQQWTPKLLRAVKGIGVFGECNLLPSGGVSPETAHEWLDAGACAVGMGSRLVGGDVRTPSDEVDAVRSARRAWDEEGRARAERLFAGMRRGRCRL
jgi:2-dehydro-3-deoxyphosphogluconate aldolase/(4S)-4-hydroxy-2-oxoglutarate aldolase